MTQSNSRDEEEGASENQSVANMNSELPLTSSRREAGASAHSGLGGENNEAHSEVSDIPNNSHYSLLYDGQCVICRFLVKEFVKPYENENLHARPFQDAQAEKAYPDSELDRCKKEILLVDDGLQEQKFLGGVEAITKLLELINQLPLLRFWLSITFLKPINLFLYRLIAWHRYTWFVIPPYLRCAECELQIPLLWNSVFFVLFGLSNLCLSAFTIHIWFQSLKEAGRHLFGTVHQSIWALSLESLGICSIVAILAWSITFASYKKVLGINKIEIYKQALLFSTLLSALTLILFFVFQPLAICIAERTDALKVSLLLFTYTGIHSLCLTAGQLIIFKRWQEINVSNWKSILILFFDFLLRSITPILILSYAF